MTVQNDPSDCSKMLPLHMGLASELTEIRNVAPIIYVKGAEYDI